MTLLSFPRPGCLRLSALCAALHFAACTAPAVAPAPVPSVHEWTRLKPGAEAAALEAPARVLGGPGALTVVTPPLRATVLRIRARAGDTVEAGAPLVDVVMPEALEAAGRLEGARVRLQAWTERHQQLTQLRADGLVKSLDVSEAAARMAESKADFQAARAVLLSAGVRESEAAGLLSGTGAMPLRAPVAGVVTHVSGAVGESRDPAAGPLVTLASRGPVRVEARFTQSAPDGDFGFVSGNGVVEELRLVARAPTADPLDGTFLAWFEPQDGGHLTAGTLGRVALAGGGESGLFRVPALALHRVEGKAQVHTRRGAVSVEVARCELLDCLVSGPLEASDEVSTEVKQ